MYHQVPLSTEFSRQEYWSGLPFLSPGCLPDPRIKPSLLYCRQVLCHLSHCAVCLVAQSDLTLCDPMDCTSSVHGILQARILEWVAMPSSRGSSPPRDWSRLSALRADLERLLNSDYQAPPESPCVCGCGMGQNALSWQVSRCCCCWGWCGHPAENSA